MAKVSGSNEPPMKKRDPEKFIANAEATIDSAWRNLPIFQSERPVALLKLITATDDRMRITALSGIPREAFFSVALRFSQDALMFGIPWIFSTCRATNTPIPEIVTEADVLEGIALAEYAEAYDSAVLAFTNYHQKRFEAFVAATDRRITFGYPSSEVEFSERERKAYEMHELESAGETSASAQGRVDAMRSLLNRVATKAVQGSGDRVELKIDTELVAALRAVMDGTLASHQAQIENSQILAGIEYGRIRRYHAALVALCHAHHFLHMSPAVGDIRGGAVSSLSFRMKVEELNAHIAEVGELAPSEVAAVSSLFTFDGSIPNMPSICQPLIRANDTEVLVPYAYTLGGRFERNFLKLLAKNPKTAKEYDKFSSLKENIALPKLVRLLRAVGVLAKDRVRITEGGRSITDIDIVAYDPRDKCLLAIQHKWLIEPDSVNESKACDMELEKAIEQARIAKAHLASRENARRVIPEIPETGEISVESMVVSKGSEETGFLSATEIPIVTEDWFISQIKSSSGLATLHSLGRRRPDRTELAGKWKSAKVSARLAGYEIRIPGFSRAV